MKKVFGIENEEIGLRIYKLFSPIILYKKVYLLDYFKMLAYIYYVRLLIGNTSI
jgi:hypothetical protein